MPWCGVDAVSREQADGKLDGASGWVDGQADMVRILLTDRVGKGLPVLV